MNGFQRNNTTLGFASWLSDSLAASTLLSNGVSMASIVAIILSCVLPLPASAEGGEGGEGGEGHRGYAQLSRESTATPVMSPEDSLHGDDVNHSERCNAARMQGEKTRGTTDIGDETELQQLRTECLRLQQMLLANEEDKGVSLRQKLARP
jgi:hypothetical protein